MRVVTLTRGGQVSIPADLRRGWPSNKIIVEETPRGLLLRPLPADPIDAAMGSLAGPGPTVDEMRRASRREEAEIDRRKWSRLADR